MKSDFAAPFCKIGRIMITPQRLWAVHSESKNSSLHGRRELSAPLHVRFVGLETSEAFVERARERLERRLARFGRHIGRACSLLRSATAFRSFGRDTTLAHDVF